MGAVFRWIRELWLGKRALGQVVERASATLPQGVAAAIFNIVGGRVLITSIVAQVEVIIAPIAPSVAVTVNLIATPTLATATPRAVCAVLNIDTYDVGELLGITGVHTDNMLPPAGAGTIEGQTVGVVLQPGTLDLNNADTSTGELSWIVHYIPLDSGAVVQAA